MEEYQQVTKYTWVAPGFDIAKKAVNELVNFVKPTFGPSQNKILINNEVQSIMLDDGVKIAEEFGSNDLLENAVLTFIKATAKKTNKRVGDGTTGSLILLQAIINQVPEIYDSLTIIKQLKNGLAEAKEQLLKKSRVITTQEELKRAAEVSCNDPKLAGIISELMFAVGLDGTIAIQDGSGMETTKELTEGMQFERGAVARNMLPNKEMKVILEEPKIFTFDRKLGTKEMRPILEKLIRLPEPQRNMILIAEDFDQDLTDLLGQSRITGMFNVVAIKAPAFGQERSEQLKDIAALCGTEAFDLSANTGEISISQAGSAKKVVVTESTTLILGGPAIPLERIQQLKALNPENEFDKQKIKDRIARLSGKVALIKIGGLTDEESIAASEKAEDAVNATRAAYKGGVVPGAGVTLAQIQTSSNILNEALKMPLKTLVENHGGDIEAIDEDLIKDPTEVLIAALESAVSIAILLISGKGILVTYQDKR